MPGMFSRRDAMKTIGLGALAASVAGGLAFGQDENQQAPPEPTEPAKYELPPLPYGYNALEPVLSEQTVRIHYGKLTAGYYEKLNAVLQKLEQARSKNNYEGIQALSRNLAYNGSGAVLHTLYWENLIPGGAAEPRGALSEGIRMNFGSFENFQKQFIAAATNVAANGWGLLVYEPRGNRLLVMQAENHENLTIWGVWPLMVIDVWEHAYYLDYENRRGAYLSKIWDIINWPIVEQRYAQALS